MKKLTKLCLILMVFGMAFIIPARAQDEVELTLNLTRDFGYSSGTGRIQGRFTMKVNGPANLERVVFLIDDLMVGEDTQAPFLLQFSTGDYALGVHTMSAVGYTSDGRELRSNAQRREFVSAEEGWQSAMKIAIPIIGLAFAAMLFSFILPSLLGKRVSMATPLGAPRSYGLLGGTVCPKCSRPFGMHVWGMNLVIGKLDRCPYCGKWSLVRRAPNDLLKAAEAAELEMAQANAEAPANSAEEKLHRDLDDSRYMDL